MTNLEPPPIEDVIHHLNILVKRYSHPPRATKSSETTIFYQKRQVEIYHLVQMTIARVHPLIQAEVHFCRSKIMEEITTQPDIRDSGFSRHSMQPQRARGFVRWYEYQITPEISFDPTITGRLASSTYVQQLKHALYAQHQAVQEVLREHIIECRECKTSTPMQA